MRTERQTLRHLTRLTQAERTWLSLTTVSKKTVHLFDVIICSE